MPRTLSVAAALVVTVVLAAQSATATICIPPPAYVLQPTLFLYAQPVPTSVLPKLSVGPNVVVADNTSQLVMEAVAIANLQQTLVFAVYNKTAQTAYLTWGDSLTQVATANTAATFTCNSAFASCPVYLAVAGNANIVYAVGSDANITMFSSVAPFAVAGIVVAHTTTTATLQAITCSPPSATTSYLYALYVSSASTYVIDIYTTAPTTGALSYVKSINTTMSSQVATQPSLSEIEGNLWFVFGGNVFQIVVYDVSTGRNITTIGGLDSPTQVVYDPIARRVYANDRFGTIIPVISAATFKVVDTLVWANPVQFIALNPAVSTQLIVGDGAYAVVVFDVTKHGVVYTELTGAFNSMIAIQPPANCPSSASSHVPTLMPTLATAVVAIALALAFVSD
jgi:hypothetical protein